MSTRLAYQWDDQARAWQIESRSGHIVYASRSLQEVRSMLARLESVPLGVRPASRAAAATGPRWPRLRVFVPNWSLVPIGALLVAIGATLLASESWQAPQAVAFADAGAAKLVQPAILVEQPSEPPKQAAVPVWETSYQKRRVKIFVPVWETREQDETYTVKRPVIETSMRYEKHVVNRPIVTQQTHYADRGSWQTVAPPQPARHTSLKWVSGGWTTDATGLTYYRLPGLRAVKVTDAPTATARKVWKPNIVPVPVTQTVYKPQIETRAVPVETVRFVEETRTRKVPVRVCRMVEREVEQQIPVVTCRLKTESVPSPKPIVREPRKQRSSEDIEGPVLVARS